MELKLKLRLRLGEVEDGGWVLCKKLCAVME